MACPNCVTRSRKKPVHAESDYVPLDGGYGWAIVFGGALTHFMLVGMARCLGILYLAIRTKFNTSAQETAWASALFNTTRSLIAPLCGKLVVRFGCRAVTLVGCLVLFSGLVISAFATNIYYIYFSFGIFTGSGGAMVFTSVYVIVGQYFDKKKGKAMGFATLGSGLGNVILAPLISLFVLYYGFFGAMLLLGALQLHHIISALLYVPLSKLGKLKPEHMASVTELEMNVDSRTAILNTEPKSDENVTKQDLDTDDFSHKADSINKESSDETPDSQTVEIEHSSNDSINKESSDKTPDSQTVEIQRSSNWRKDSLYCNLTFFIYGLVIMSLQCVIPTFLIFLPSFAKEHGASDTSAAIALSVMGVADMCGRFASGFIYDLKQVRKNRRFVYCVNSVLFAAATIAMTFMPNYVAIVTMTAVTGLFEGGAHGQRMTILSEFVPPHQVAPAVGMVIFFQGVGNIWGPPVAGALRDAYGTCAYGYAFVGSMLLFFTLLFAMQLGIVWKRSGKNSDK